MSINCLKLSTGDPTVDGHAIGFQSIVSDVDNSFIPYNHSAAELRRANLEFSKQSLLVLDLILKQQF